MNQVPTVGIIGLGIGRAHIRAFKDAGAEVVAISQRDEAGARAIADRHGVPQVYGRWQDLIEKAKPDLVAVTTPPHLHREITLAAFAAGAHVLCEKPLAMDRAETDAMIAGAALHKKVGMTAFNWRYVRAMQMLHERIKAGAVGRVLHVNARWYSTAFADPKTATWRLDRAQAGHGAMGDMGVHVVDLIRWNIGEIARVSAAAGVAYAERSAPGVARGADADDFIHVTGELAGGGIASITVSRVAHGLNEQGMEVVGTEGTLAYKLIRTGARWHDGQLSFAPRGAALAPVALPEGPDLSGNPDPMEITGGALFAPLARDFIAAARKGEAASPSFEDGRKAQIVLDAILDSLARGGWAAVGG